MEHLRNFLFSQGAVVHPGEMGFKHKDPLLRKGRGLCWFFSWYFFIWQFLFCSVGLFGGQLLLPLEPCRMQHRSACCRLAALGKLHMKASASKREGKIPASVRCAWCCRVGGPWTRTAWLVLTQIRCGYCRNSMGTLTGLHQYKLKGIVTWKLKKLLFKLKRCCLRFFPLFLHDVSAVSENTEFIRTRGHLWASPSQIAMGSGGRSKTCLLRLLCHMQRLHWSNRLSLHPGLLLLQKRGCVCGGQQLCNRGDSWHCQELTWETPAWDFAGASVQASDPWTVFFMKPWSKAAAIQCFKRDLQFAGVQTVELPVDPDSG